MYLILHHQAAWKHVNNPAHDAVRNRSTREGPKWYHRITQRTPALPALRFVVTVRFPRIPIGRKTKKKRWRRLCIYFFTSRIPAPIHFNVIAEVLLGYKLKFAPNKPTNKLEKKKHAAVVDLFASAVTSRFSLQRRKDRLSLKLLLKRGNTQVGCHSQTEEYVGTKSRTTSEPIEQRKLETSLKNARERGDMDGPLVI